MSRVEESDCCEHEQSKYEDDTRYDSSEFRECGGNRNGSSCGAHTTSTGRRCYALLHFRNDGYVRIMYETHTGQTPTIRKQVYRKVQFCHIKILSVLVRVFCSHSLVFSSRNEMYTCRIFPCHTSSNVLWRLLFGVMEVVLDISQVVTTRLFLQF